ncbi:putative zinc finger protein 876 isoform X1 [Paramacrobiotus metropolitanus]|uniref:putative zinc finger protein 876 isoform X1 n=1 Tax=Paramacrobiotus metropolitanus TaxID=2943436 RepID=UPI0024455F13|nr:putative zinc finger protein 876 isoform X1 [Paramacrobiotus metropolitanus]
MFSFQHNIPLWIADGSGVASKWAQGFAARNAMDVKQEPEACNWYYRQDADKVQCGTCSKLYASKKSLKIHNRIHTGYKPYACPICPKRFTQTNVLKAHINYHTGRRDWLCKICGKAFTQSAHLRTHEKTHSNRKDYQCPYCQQNFSCKGVRDRHIRQHTGEKPYKCLLCEKRFTRGESLKFHENAHQGIRPYSCPHEHCRKTFTKQSSLKRHIRSAHSGLASSFRVRSAKFSSPLAHVSGCSAIFPTTVASPSANSDCVSTTGSSTAGPGQSICH